jgi:Flp pilus assembly protein TadG
MLRRKLHLRGLIGTRPGRDAGQALVETALVMPLLILILLGAVELAKVAFAAIEVSNAAKAAVQYGAQSGTTAADTAGMLTAAQNDANFLTGLQLTSVSTSCVCSDGTASTCLNTDCPSSHIEETLTVQTQATYDPLIHLPGLPTTYTLSGQATQKCLQ